MGAVVTIVLLLTAALLLYIFMARPKLPAAVEAIIDQAVQSEPGYFRPLSLVVGGPNASS
jgi:hypothetical protein